MTRGKGSFRPTFDALEDRRLTAAVASYYAPTRTLTIDSASDPAANPTILRTLPGGATRWSDGAGHGGVFPGVARVVVNGAGRDLVDAHGFAVPLVIHGAMNANVPAPRGYAFGEYQQRQTPNCGFVAAVNAEILHGRFHPSIIYAGVFTYRVDVGNLHGFVHFDGRADQLDPAQAGAAFWPALLNREYFAVRGAEPIAATDAIRLIRGVSPYAFDVAKSYAVTLGADSFGRNALLSGLAAGKSILLGTHFSGTGPIFGIGPTVPQVVQDHYYAVLGAFYVGGSLYVAAWNPWGYDNFTSATSGNPNDGVVVLPWAAWAYSIQTVEAG